MHCLLVLDVSEQNDAGSSPFPGRAGILFNRLLAAAQLSEDLDYYYINANSMTSGIPPSELLLLRNQAAHHIMQVKPDVVVAIGENALQLLTNQQGIAYWQGSVIPGYNTYIVPMQSPMQLLAKQDWQGTYLTARFLERARHVANRSWQQEAYFIALDPTLQEALDFIGNAHNAARYTLDVETAETHITCVGLAYRKPSGETVAMSIPTMRLDKMRWMHAETEQVWSALQKLLQHNPHAVLHNLNFDEQWFRQYNVKIGCFAMDTMQGFNLLHPGWPKNLGFVTAYYGVMPYFKHEGGRKASGKSVTNKQYWTYNAKDCIATLWISEKIDEELHATGQYNQYYDERKPVQQLALHMQRTGLETAPKRIAAAREMLLAQQEMLQTRLNEEAGCLLNAGSPKQVAAHLFDVLKLKPYVRSKRSTNEGVLKKLQLHYPNMPQLQTILKLRGVTKLLSSYINIKLEGNHVPYTANSAGTETFRWTFSKSAQRKGLNVQTVPKAQRKLFIPGVGYTFIQPDLSQVEARIIAALSRCQGLLALFNDPTRNVHLENAVRIFGRKVEKTDREYDIAKRIVHARNYKMGAQELAMNLGITQRDANKLFNVYDQLYPELHVWHNAVKREVQLKGVLVNPFGYRRHFYDAVIAMALNGAITDKQWKEAIAWVPQSIPPEIINRVMQIVVAKLPTLKLHVHTHDGFLASAPNEQLQDACDIIDEAFRLVTKNIVINGMTVQLPWELTTGPDWYDMKPRIG